MQPRSSKPSAKRRILPRSAAVLALVTSASLVACAPPPESVRAARAAESGELAATAPPARPSFVEAPALRQLETPYSAALKRRLEAGEAPAARATPSGIRSPSVEELY